MQYVITEYFKKHLKAYLKKYRSLLEDVICALENFDHRTSISLGYGTYKVRIKSSDLNKGKSGGFRLIILILEVNQLITPIVIYFKGEKSDISKEEILFHAAFVQKELESR